MPDFPTRLDLYAKGRAYVLARAKRIDPAQVDVAGSDVNILVASASFMAYQVVLQLAQKVNSLLLDGALDEDLDRYAFDRYQLPRKGAAGALGVVIFFRDSSVAGGGSVPAGTRLLSLTGIEYVTTTTATFSVTGLSASAEVRAVKAGKEYQVGRYSLRRIADPGALFDPTLQVTNNDPTAGGEPREEDNPFRERIRDFWRTVRRGTIGAIEFGATAVAGVDSAEAAEAIDSEGQPARVVTLYIADSSGVANTALGTAVLNSLEEYRAAGIAVIPTTSVPEIVAVQLKLSFSAGVDTSTLSEQIRSAVVGFVNSLGVNQTLYRNDLGSVLRRFKRQGLIPTEDSVVSPAGDLVPTIGTTLRTSIDNVTLV